MTGLANGLDFEDMFELAPVSLWMEDYSALKQLFDQWRSQGVTELLPFLMADPRRLLQCSQAYKVLRVNQFTLQLFKAPDQATLIERIGEVFRDDMLSGISTELLALWNGELGFETRSYNYALDGRRLSVLIRARVVPGYEQCWSRMLISLEDVTAEEAGTQQLRRSEQYARDLFEYSPVALWVDDFSEVKALLEELRADGVTDLRAFLRLHPDFVDHCMRAVRIVDVNRQTLRMFGASHKEHLIANVDQVFRQEMRASVAEQLLDLWAGKLEQQREVVCHTLSGHPLHIHMELSIFGDHAQQWDLVQLSMVDITERKNAAAYLEYLSQHDVLTQLYNRAFYMAEMQRLERQGLWPISVLLLDVNGMKQVNDEHGHAAGDAMLRRIGEILRQAVQAPACAARVGGDEFTVLLPAVDAAGAQALQERIAGMLALNNQFYPGETIHLSMGCATAEPGEALEAVVHRADQAMYTEKARFYTGHGQRNRRATAPLPNARVQT